MQNRIVYLNKEGSVINDRSFKNNISFSNSYESYCSVLTSEEDTNVYCFDALGYITKAELYRDIVAAYNFRDHLVLRKKSSITIPDYDMTLDISPGAKDVLYHDGHIYICYSDNILSFKCS